MELVTFKMIIDIGISLFNVTKSLSGKEKRKNLGDWLHDLGVLVEDIAVKLESREFPHTSCSKMSYMVDHFDEMMTGHLDDTELSNLQKMLNQARNIERLYGELSQLPAEEKSEKIVALKETAGTLQAAGDMLTR
jgi:hypothetical protein